MNTVDKNYYRKKFPEMNYPYKYAKHQEFGFNRLDPHTPPTLEEYNNPMPKWWSWLFVITVIFALVYLALYPGLGSFKGVLGWSAVGQYNAERERMDATVQPMYSKYLGMDVKALAADKQAMETGKRLYLTYCMQCHGADGRGAKGFPNLTDGDWLYGGEPEQIKQTIAEGRMGVMPAHAQLGADTIKDLANYVRSLSGLPNDSVRAAKGKEAFTSAGCVGCHGMDAKGMQAIGAPNLTDKVWLHGWGEAAIVAMINAGKTNMMPAFGERLNPEQIHVLAAYVWSLSQTSALAAK